MYVIQRSKTGHYVRTVHTPQAGECALKPVDLNEVPGADEEGAPQARDVRVTIDVTLLGGPTLETDITVREGKNNAETRSHALLALQEEMDEARRNADELGALLATPPAWALDIPLAASGFEAYRYRKD